MSATCIYRHISWLHKSLLVQRPSMWISVLYNIDTSGGPSWSMSGQPAWPHEAVAFWNISPKLMLHSYSTAITYFAAVMWECHFVQITTVILQSSVQNFISNWQSKCKMAARNQDSVCCPYFQHYPHGGGLVNTFFVRRCIPTCTL